MFEKVAVAVGGTIVGVMIVGGVVVYRKLKDLGTRMDKHEDNVHKVIWKTDKAVKDLAEMTTVEIREDMVKRAVAEAVNREVRASVTDAVRDIRSDIRAEINSGVRNEIQSQKEKLISDVDRKLVEEVDKISRDEIVDDVRRKVTNSVIDRFSRDFSEIRDKYSRKMEENISDMTRQYRRRLESIGDDKIHFIYNI